MPEIDLPRSDPEAFDRRMRAEAAALHARDQAPASLAAWQERREPLRRAMFAAMGPVPEQPCALEARVAGVLARRGYRIERLVFQSRPDIWVTANVYVPEPTRGRLPAVLVVHGHWAGARRDPVVQARCLGLVKLGFVVLAVDAFGAGERYTTPAPGTYHGALYGSTLWPAGHTLLGMQVYDNRRAVDYLRGRPEVAADRIGITGASGGGNQSMYAGALDERLRAVVPVCSVGNYQAYLRAACCVCEVLPGALRFTEEGDVLGLVAPRALLVINATRDAFQFSVAEARRSLERARPIYRLHDAEERLRHATFESPHAYNQAMREAMYGWMTRWLKNEGDGAPIAEPAHDVERPEDLACYPDGQRPRAFLFPPSFAAQEARVLLARVHVRPPDHAEDWESTAVHLRTQLRRHVLGDFPTPPRPLAQLAPVQTAGPIRTVPILLHPEPDLPLSALLRSRANQPQPAPACVLLHLDGKTAALNHGLATELIDRNWTVVAPDLRATGAGRPANDAVRGAPDHNGAEHALWLGRPLLGQWIFDVQCLLDWMAVQPALDRRRLVIVGLGQAGVVALCAAGLLHESVAAAASIGGPVTYVTEEAYGAGTHMGLLAPGILRVGDIPHLAALSARRRLFIAEGRTPQGQPLPERELREAFAFTRTVYRVHRAETRLVITPTLRAGDLAAGL